MQSVDEFTPSTTEPVFGSGLISQTKSQTLTNNDVNDNEKIVPPSEPIVNGENDTTINKITSNENITNGTTENIDAGDLHVNGKDEKSTVETTNEVQPVEELNNEVKLSEEIINEVEPEPVLSTPVDTANESSAIVPTATVETAPPPPVVETTTNANVPEAPVATESETTEPKSKSPRGKVKAPVASTTPVRQSTRARKPVPSTSANDDDIDEITTPIESSKRTKRQAATSSIADDQDVDITEGNIKNVSPSGTKKRAASKTTKSVDVTSESEPIETPPKKARASANKKTPEPPSEEYVRKLRPRK